MNVSIIHIFFLQCSNSAAGLHEPSKMLQLNDLLCFDKIVNMHRNIFQVIVLREMWFY